MPLAFPAPALYDEGQDDDGYSQSPADVAPTLPTFEIDPAFLADELMSHDQPLDAQRVQAYEQHDFYQDQDAYDREAGRMHGYPQDGPAGPPPEPELLPEEPDEDYIQPQPKPHKKSKRVRRPRRENECGFCQGSDERNQNGAAETMLSCSNCGRSGHPTCLDIAEIVDTVFSYPWTCIECKPCEICQQKGDDTKLLFCDNCDRGWHYDCLDPPLDGTPEGDWNCPLCPSLPENPVASTSYEGGSFVNASDTEVVENDLQAEAEAEEAFFVVPNKRKRPPSSSRPKTKGKRPNQYTYRNALNGEVNKKARPSQHGPGRPSGARSIPKQVTSKPAEPRVTFRLRLSGGGRGNKHDEELVQKSPFEAILNPEEYDTAKTSVLPDDKNRFEKSRINSETKITPKLQPQISTLLLETPGASSSIQQHTPLLGSTHRPLRSFTHLLPSKHQSTFEDVPSTPTTPVPTFSGDGLRIRTLRFGQWDIDTWYDAPFPAEYNNIPEGRLWMCEFCLRYMKTGFGWERHQTKCKARHPPGDEIYRDDSVSVFEVDGRKNKIYCQNLCLLSKMFLDHKSLFYDVEPFLFYVMTEVDDGGARFVGYFSKEKRSPKDYNVSCIMTLPVRQRKGWGNLLIDFSFLLSKKEARVGSPERPLSALGALSYRNYWTLAIMQYLQNAPDHVTFEDISASTSMTLPDIVTTLREQGMLIAEEERHIDSPTSRSPSVKSKGKGKARSRSRPHPFGGRRSNNMNRKQQTDAEFHPPTAEIMIPRDYTIQWDRAVVEAYLARRTVKGYLKLKPHSLKWSPYLLARTPKSATASAPIADAEHLYPVRLRVVIPSAVEDIDNNTPSAVEQTESGIPATAGTSSTVLDSKMEVDIDFDLEHIRTPAPTPPTKSGNGRDDDDNNSIFDPDEEDSAKTPPRPRLRQPLYVNSRSNRSLRKLPSRRASETSDTRSYTRSSYRRQDQVTHLTTNHSPPLPLDIPKRKRPRPVSSERESSLSEPPTTYTRSSPDNDDLGEVGHRLPQTHLNVNGHTNGNGHRRTRSRLSLESTVTTEQSLPVVVSPSVSRRSSVRLNGDDHSRFNPMLLEDPKETPRSSPKKARLDSIGSHPLATEISMPVGSFAANRNSSNTLANLSLNGSFLGDVDAEGEEDDVIGAVSLPIEQGDDGGDGDLDAEGEEEEIDAEGEME